MANETLSAIDRSRLHEDEELRARAYAQWKRNPASVEDSVAAFFEGFELGARRMLSSEDAEARRRFDHYRSPEFTRQLSEAFARAKEKALVRTELH